MLRRADTIGVFQVESRAQMATLPRMKPQRFYDLVVEVAIIRPGPIVGKMVHPYLNRRAGREPVTYAHPDLEPILKRTLGVPLFQEQLLRMAMAVAGFTGGEAEELRRAMGFKRSVERMAKIERAAARPAWRRAASRARRRTRSCRGSPRSRSTASPSPTPPASRCSPTPRPTSGPPPGGFLAALLNAWPMGFYHPATLVKDAQRHGVRVLPIDVNTSGVACRVEVSPAVILSPSRGGGAGEGSHRAWSAPCSAEVRWDSSAAARPQNDNPVPAIRHPDRATVPESCGAARPTVRQGPARGGREAHRGGGGQRRRSLRCARWQRAAGLRNDELAALAEIGAFACLGQTRRSALWQVSALDGRRPPLAQAMQPDPPPSQLPEMTLRERYVADYLGSGVTVGRHPLALRRMELAGRGILSAAQLARVRDGQLVRVAGVVIVRQRPYTAKGMCFMTLEDETGFANIAVMPNNFDLQRAVITSQRPARGRGPRAGAGRRRHRARRPLPPAARRHPRLTLARLPLTLTVFVGAGLARVRPLSSPRTRYPSCLSVSRRVRRNCRVSSVCRARYHDDSVKDPIGQVERRRGPSCRLPSPFPRVRLIDVRRGAGRAACPTG